MFIKGLTIIYSTPSSSGINSLILRESWFIQALSQLLLVPIFFLLFIFISKEQTIICCGGCVGFANGFVTKHK